jgi:uncharacterized delta-60 repeat protein
LKEKKSITASSKRITILLIIVIMATASALRATPMMDNQNQQSGNHSSASREGASPTGIYWAKTYAGNRSDIPWSVRQTSDGGYIVAGYTDSFDVSGWHFWVLKLNSTGGIQWQKTYGGSGDDYAWSVQQTSDGGYIVAGYTNSSGAGGFDFWVLKLNSTGGIQWQKTYGGTGTDDARSVQQTSDGGYIVAGYTTSFGSGNPHVWVLKLNSTGGIQWQKTYGGTKNDYESSVKQTSDGGYIVAGYTNSFGAGGYDAWVLKLNSTGGVQWQNTYGSTGTNYAWSVQQTSDGGYIVAGYTNSSGAGGYDAWVFKLNSTGGVTWQKTYGGPKNDVAWSIQQTSDGGYVVAGFTNSFGVGTINIWVLKLNSTGGVTWQKTFGGTGIQNAWSVQQTSDEGYILTGDTTSFGDGNSHVWVLKLDSTGSLVWNEGSGASTQSTTVVPSNSNATITSTSATVVNTNAIVENTSVTPQDTNATVTVQSSPDTTPPATITNLAASTPTNTSITLTWTAPGNDGMKGNATVYVLKYSTSGAITDANWSSATTYTQTWTPAMNGTTETHIITGLTPGTKYWFAVEAYDEVPNYSGVSNSASETTLAPSTGEGGGAGSQIILLACGAIIASVMILIMVVSITRKRRVNVPQQ